MSDSQNDAGKLRRRSFLLRSGAAVGGLMIVPRYILGGGGMVPPSDRVNVAVIGTGGQGITNIKALFKHADCRVIAIADPNEESDYSRFYYGGTAGRKPALSLIEKHYAETDGGTAPHCIPYLDFREMLDEVKEIDAVLVATPDHVHASATISAMERGKHVYCEKPLVHDVAEARKVVEVARKTGVATQMGNQGHSGDGIRQTCEWIWDGAIGKIREVYGWTGATGWASGGRPTETPPIPAGFDWDLWLGPAPYRPYHPAYAPYNWRGWWQFGTGGIGDMACHNLDPAFWALKLGHPLTVEAIDTDRNPETVPSAATVRYTFPSRGEFPPVTVTWYDGNRVPPRPEGLPANEPLDGNGVVFIGETGTILCKGWGGAPRLLPQEKAASYQPPAPTLKRSAGHHRDWLDACKGGPEPSGSFPYSAHLTEVVLLGNVAEKVPGKLEWDGEAMRFKNSEKATQLLSLPRRKGWEI